jgi:hypothetical protein
MPSFLLKTMIVFVKLLSKKQIILCHLKCHEVSMNVFHNHTE